MKKKEKPLLLAEEAFFITPKVEKSCFNGTMGAMAHKFAP